MIPVQTRRAGLGPMPAAGFDQSARGGPAGATPPPGASPSGMGGPPPRFKLSGAEYKAGRAGWKSYLHQRSAAKHETRAAKQTYRSQLSEMTGGKLSTGRSHRGFHSAMGAYARRKAATQGGGEPEAPSTALTVRGAAAPASSQALTPYRPSAAAGRGGGGDLHAAMGAYFAKREARRAKYSSMRGGVSPQRSRSARPGQSGPAPSPRGEAQAPALEAPASGVSIEEVDDDAPVGDDAPTPSVEEPD
jgi:hypothetical protein